MALHATPVMAYVGLGANLGQPRVALRSALAALARYPATRLRAHSGLYRSTPLDAPGPDYLNAVAALETRLTAPDLLARLQQQEHSAGRERPYRHAPRTLDLDLLLYGQGRICSAALQLPHPRMRERAFVLRPLAELAPRLVDEGDLQRVRGQICARMES